MRADESNGYQQIMVPSYSSVQTKKITFLGWFWEAYSIRVLIFLLIFTITSLFYALLGHLKNVRTAPQMSFSFRGMFSHWKRIKMTSDFLIQWQKKSFRWLGIALCVVAFNDFSNNKHFKADTYQGRGERRLILFWNWCISLKMSRPPACRIHFRHPKYEREGIKPLDFHSSQSWVNISRD